MAHPASRWPGPTPAGDDNTTLPPEDLYKSAVEEYRFQAQFNWSRTQYLLVFNAAAVAAASALLTRSAAGAAVVFALGAIGAVASLFAVKTQHGYYRAARDRMKLVEEHVHVPEPLRINTTTSLGGPSRLVSVNQIVSVLFMVIAAADIAGIVIAFVG